VKIYSANEFASREVAVEWAVEGLVPAHGINLLYADPKVGKSILSVQLAHALGTGTPLLEHAVHKTWRVLYIQADEPESEWIKQLKMLNINTAWDTVWLPKWPSPMFHPPTYTELQKVVKEYDFVIADSIFSLFGFPEIKTPAQAGLIIQKFEQLTTAPLWVIHHKRKSSPGIPDQSTNSAAGSFALTGAASTLYDLGKSKLEARGRVVAETVHMKRARNGLWILDSEGDSGF
jgi:RecA-family ATPase